MRDVRLLLRAEISAEKVSDYKWRSSEEIAFYLNGLKGSCEVAATAALDRQKLTKAYADLVQLQGRLDTLSSIDVAIAYDFKKHRGRLSPMVTAIREELEGKRNRALRTLQKAARKNAPTELTAAITTATKMLGTRLASSYTKMDDYVYATAYGKNGFEFNHYIQIDGLHNPHVEFTYPEYYVVLTARVLNGKVTLHANTLHEFRSPGSFNVGDALTPDQLETVLTALLHADEFISDADGKELQSTPLDVRWFKTPVQSLTIDKRCIRAEFVGSRAQAAEYAKVLRGELHGALAKQLDGHVFKCRIQAKGKDRWCCSYTAMPVQDPKGLDAYGENVLRNQLNLTNDQITAVRRLLTKGY